MLRLTGVGVLMLALLAVSVVGREKRAVVTIDFGMILRNVLLKSAQLSNAKANLVRSKAMPAPAPTTTTTPPPPPPPPPPPATPSPAPPPPPPPRRRRPIYGPGWRHFDFYQPFDYDYDAAPVPRRVRPPPRPLPTARPDYDYDYEAGPNPEPASTAPPPPPPPPPPPASPPTRRPMRRPGPPAQLGDRLIYQYAQPTDTYSRPGGNGGGPSNRFLVNYENEEEEEEGAEKAPSFDPFNFPTLRQPYY